VETATNTHSERAKGGAGAATVPRPARSGRPPGRPRRDAGPAVGREDIVATARRILSASGPEGLALRDVARRLDVSLATVQRHFPTKDELWRACVDAMLPGQPAPASRQASDASVLGAELVAQLHRQVGAIVSGSGVAAAMWHDTGRGAEQRLAYLSDRAGALVEGNRQRLRAAAAAGSLRPIDADVFLALVGLGVTSMVSEPEALRRLFAIDLDEPGQVERVANALADLLLNGVLSRRNEEGAR